MKTYYLRNWDKKRDVYNWNGERLTKEFEYAEETDGYFKKMFMGPKIYIIREGRSWVFFIGKERFSCNDVSCVYLNQIGVITTLKLIINGKVYKFRECSTLDFFSRILDPTYDSIDAEEVFSIWFIEVNNLDVKKEK